MLFNFLTVEINASEVLYKFVYAKSVWQEILWIIKKIHEHPGEKYINQNVFTLHLFYANGMC